jgi:adenylate kinase
MTNRIVILGPPGAGKGTQAVMICEALGIPHISTGEILRAAVAAESELGNKVKSFLDAGDLVPDQVIVDIMSERLQQEDCSNGFLLDGFPRTVNQAEMLDQVLSELSMELTQVIDLRVPDEVLIERIKGRAAASSGTRSDDTEEVAANRLQVYWEQTAPVSAFYRESGSMVELDGLGTIEEVNQRILDSLPN